MTGREWVEQLAEHMRPRLREKTLEIRTNFKLAYCNEIRSYRSSNKTAEAGHSIDAADVENDGGEGWGPDDADARPYRTDLAIIENIAEGRWRPRVVIEAKLTRAEKKSPSVTTHDALTYSAKAATHRAVHPYLRYGIMLGNSSLLPGRLYRHGAQFDFMFCFRTFDPSASELKGFADLLHDEVLASRKLEKLLYERNRYTTLHRKLEVR